MGAVATTFMAGVEAIRRGIAKPIGSLTQMGTIRLGKRTENRSPLIKEFVPLAKLEDIVFGGWDLFPDDAYQAAAKAGVLSSEHLAAGEAVPVEHQADDAGVRPGLREEADRHPLEDRQVEDGPGRAGDRGHRELPQDEQLRPSGDGLVRIDRGVPRAGPGARQRGRVREGPARERSGDRPVADLRLRRAEERRAVRQRRPQPDRRHPGAAGAGPGEQRSPGGQGLQDRPDVHEDPAGAGPEGAHARASRAGTRPTSSATATARCWTIPSH